MFSWFSFLTYAAVTAVTPGPNNIMSMSNGGRLGFRRALPFNLGIWAGFTLVMCMCTLFCSALSALIPRICVPMMIIGAGYMLYLAWETLRSRGVEERNGHSGFVSGALLLAFIGFVATLCWSGFGSAFKVLFSRHARVVNTIMALLLVYCAVSLFLH